MRIALLGVVGAVTLALYVWHFRGEHIRIVRDEYRRRRVIKQLCDEDPEFWPVFHSNNVDFSDENEVM